tara:strand:+ start:806 stop:952 length:147 start_codon:yes stop_codon:yes gene_type:complete
MQEIFQAPEADLLQMFAELLEEREIKQKQRGLLSGQDGIANLLKSRKA